MLNEYLIEMAFIDQLTGQGSIFHHDEILKHNLQINDQLFNIGVNL